MIRLATLSLVALVGCGDAADAERVAELEERIAELEKRGPAGPAAAKPGDEAAAGKLLQVASAAVDAGDVEQAKASMKELNEKYAGTRAFRAGVRMKQEIDVLGKDTVPFEVEKWFQGSAADVEDKATLVVFWETWCPHCKREVPKLEALYEKYDGKGLSVVGVTKMSRGVTEDQVKSFLTDNNVSYPIAYESDGALSQAYAISGIPAAVVLKDGKVAWRGHPARIKDDMIARWLGDS